jgi:hypothetical protein
MLVVVDRIALVLENIQAKKIFASHKLMPLGKAGSLSMLRMRWLRRSSEIHV